MPEQAVLTTARLVLRPFSLADAADVRRLAGDREIAATTLAIPHPYGEGEAERWIATQREAFANGESATFAITLRVSDELAGAVSLGIRPEFDRAEMGYWIGKPYWGRGYCTEAARAILGYGFGELGLNRIFAVHFEGNPASGRVMQKIGMTREGVQRQHVKHWGEYVDLVGYGILRAEYLAATAQSPGSP